MKKITLFILVFSTTAALAFLSCARELTGKEDIIALYRDNIDVFADASSGGNFSAVERLRGVESVYISDDGAVEIMCGGNKIGPGTHYYGIFYDADLDAADLTDADAYEESGDGYVFRERDGDNVRYIEPLGDGYFYFEEHY